MIACIVDLRGRARARVAKILYNIIVGAANGSVGVPKCPHPPMYNFMKIIGTCSVPTSIGTNFSNIGRIPGEISSNIPLPPPTSICVNDVVLITSRVVEE